MRVDADGIRIKLVLSVWWSESVAFGYEMCVMGDHDFKTNACTFLVVDIGV